MVLGPAVIHHPTSPRAWTMRPEAELLLSCARVRLDPEGAERIQRLLRKDLDWAYIFRRAHSSGMMPLLYWHLRATSPGVVPEAILHSLQDHFYKVAGYNLFLTKELLDLLKLFEGHGIRAIPFKGPVLAAGVYGNLGLRQFADLDLLVRTRDVPQAKALLISRGYRPELEPTPAQDLALIRHHHSLSFLRKQERVVEIHWRFAQRSYSIPLDPEPLWERAVSIPLDGQEIPTFSPEDLLLILCTHGARHAWDRLVWICDIAELTRTYTGMDWGWVLDQSARLRSTRILLLGLFLAHDLLGASFAEEILYRMWGDPAIQTLASQVRERLFADTNDPVERAETFLFFLRARECVRDRVRHCLALAMTPSLDDWKSVPLPASLTFLYYFIRPIRVSRKIGPGLLRRLA